jgi:hypothetical protein
MRYGDKDGFKEIYDEKGELILHPGEKILVAEENVVPSLKSTWRYYGGEYLLEPSKGTIYLTNERFVFINIPERMFAIGNNDEARAMSAPVQSSFELGDMSPGAAVREFFEIPNIEIMGSEKKEGAVSVGVMVNVFILSSGNQYHLSTVLTSESELLMRLMNKQVDNLDQLVNNLKDFFRKTEWMFMEGEKKLYASRGAEKEKPKEQPRIPDQPSVTPPRNVPPPVSRGPIPPPVRPVRQTPVNREVGAKSKEYFDNLYRKGLIKEDIYRKLVVQYQVAEPVERVKQEMPAKEDIPPLETPEPAQPVEEGPAVAEAVEPPPEPEAPHIDQPEKEQDDDLLNMLSDTLSDLKDEGSSDTVEPEKPPENSKPIKAKKIHRIQ